MIDHTDIREQLILLEKAVLSREQRHTLRVLRSLPSMRKRLSNNVFLKLSSLFYNGRHNTDDVSKIEFVKHLEVSL